MASKPRFAVRFTRPAEQDLKRIDRQFHRQIRDAIDKLKDGPRPFNSESLSGTAKGYFRLPTGEYRIVYSIDYAAREVYVTRIRHRGEVYRDA